MQRFVGSLLGPRGEDGLSICFMNANLHCLPNVDVLTELEKQWMVGPLSVDGLPVVIEY